MSTVATISTRTASAAMLGMLALSACSPPGLPGGPDLAASDVITLEARQLLPNGYYGVESVVITQDTISGRYVLPDGTEVFAVEQELEPEERAPVESYTLRAEGFSEGMEVIAEQAPDGWGTSLTAWDVPTGPDRYLAPWPVSGPVLWDLNEMLLEGDGPGCDAPTGEIRVLHVIGSRDPELVATRPLCPEQPSAAAAASLRGL